MSLWKLGFLYITSHIHYLNSGYAFGNQSVYKSPERVPGAIGIQANQLVKPLKRYIREKHMQVCIWFSRVYKSPKLPFLEIQIHKNDKNGNPYTGVLYTLMEFYIH